MNDFRLEVFNTVAEVLSFTKASQILHISQPAISKHIQELESSYNVRLFVRNKNKIELSPSGELFRTYSISIHKLYKELESEMALLSQNHKGELIIGASTTISQYLLPSIIAKYMARFPEVKLSLTNGNTLQIEQHLLSNRIDVGMIEGKSHKTDFRYEVLSRDELVLVCSSTHKTPESVTLSQLKELPLVLREGGSGTLEVIESSLHKHSIKISDLNVVIQLGSTESIKHFLYNSYSYAIVSIASVLDELNENKLKIIDIEELVFERDFSIINNVGSQNRLAEHFCEFAKMSLDVSIVR